MARETRQAVCRALVMAFERTGLILRTAGRFSDAPALERRNTRM